MNTPDERGPATGNPIDLEQAIIEADQQETPERRRQVLVSLATSTVTVILDRPWDRQSLPDPATRFLMVSDGADTEQHMVALFTTPARASSFLDGLDTRGEFDHPTEVPGAWSLLGVPEGAGVFINPNQPPAFRIGREVAAQLRSDVQDAMERAASRGRGADPEDSAQ